MPDILRYQLTGQTDVTLSVARIQVEGELRDSQTGAVIQDFTGPNAILFALRVQGFTGQQYRYLTDQIAATILRMKAGLE
jgi:hypothetical protein